MAFRKMRRHGQQLKRDECEHILRTARRGVLAVQGDDGYPYAIPLNFVYDNGSIYFHCATSGHKIDAITACDKCSFCVMDEGVPEPDDWWYHVRSVVAFGRICRMTDDAAIVDALRKLGAKYFPQGYDIEGDIQKNLARVAVLQLSVEHMTGKHVREK